MGPATRTLQVTERSDHVAERALDPEAILDTVFDHGPLFLEPTNRVSVPARKVVTVLRKPAVAPDGVTDIVNLSLFTKKGFLAPDKAIGVSADSVSSNFALRQPNLVHVSLTRNQGVKTMATQVSHDVRIYQGLPYITGRRAK